MAHYHRVIKIEDNILPSQNITQSLFLPKNTYVSMSKHYDPFLFNISTVIQKRCVPNHLYLVISKNKL